MRKNILNKNILNNMLSKKKLHIELMEEREKKFNYFDEILNDFFIPESIEELILDDPKLGFSNNYFDYEYYDKIFKGFSNDGWDCIDILVNNTNNDLIEKDLLKFKKK